MFKSLFAFATLALIASIANISFTPVGVSAGSYGHRRGVNLGGWLVLERWITPDSPIYTESGLTGDVVENGQYQIMKALGHARGDPLMERHWATFYTEADFRDIKAAGLDMVRIPVGYWLLNDAPATKARRSANGTTTDDASVLAPGSLAFLDKAFRWARKYQLKVLVGVHAAMGSQNGEQHSAASSIRKIQWFDKAGNIDNTLDLVEFLVDRYQYHAAFLGIGLLNEPQHGNDPTKFAQLKQYYKDAHRIIRRELGSDCIITFSTAFNEKPEFDAEWRVFLKHDPNVWAEVHKYYIWGFEGQNFDQIKAYVKGHEAQWIKEWTGAPLFFGEWSIANHEDTFVLSDAQKTQYANLVTQVFKPAHWTYWTWKFWADPNAYVAWNMKTLFQRKIMTTTMLGN
ncbi:hypothetical protein SPRG_04954 [Saprolegnia parasitica CBS 223.65]|uniref:glucan 1,3-beta-glucosidase n=1 Tax=Saprolegnia parasitica (strain CBS 223.65) TaxID=695850 RepID=A0A067CSW2_SAPPC|nr:hypothetical protein SPRG_04954 [Saprolegnia parasitica CBS 223.65]KDO29887.1 hypothetical protein SPRG_04954 [Saprolegnia parasitica CBS 223.65]|eukprot:XP_012199482.1 hypothetical protein SPRG_04954 [Saprolegnia parasitica CBS 223.65]